ncbi:MAG TPA: ATP-binding protein [Saprospiraceae bacterium]|jgi:predicted AAA+ superfamily ATPase|nr:ATP-binding protein [Saprospiraceae bacterium]HRP40789.1 ATP-binding protein [Saprospiraceae bacterium]
MDSVLIQRKLADHIREVARYYPVISVAGPRQAGKSTMLKQVFSDYQYISLEEPDMYQFATTDARGFFEKYDEGIIIDEAQKVPELFSYLQGIVDNKRTPGRFVLSGSQNYLMHRNITQSLAGRIDLSTLLPFDFSEMNWMDSWNESAEKVMLNGFYPGKLTGGIPGKIFYSNYIKTYIERDVTDLINVGNLTVFRTFLKLIAYKCGTQIKLTDMSNDLNISVNTVKTWISILESSYIVFMLPSYHKNYGKRLLKSPKLYFFDTGLLCYLLGVNDEQKLQKSDNYGMIFENMIIAEKTKYNYHRQIDRDMFFFRDSNGMEVDLFEPDDFGVKMTEIKSGKTFKPEFLTNMKKLKSVDDALRMNIIYDGEKSVALTTYNVTNWRSMHT